MSTGGFAVLVVYLGIGILLSVAATATVKANRGRQWTWRDNVAAVLIIPLWLPIAFLCRRGGHG